MGLEGASTDDTPAFAPMLHAALWCPAASLEWSLRTQRHRRDTVYRLKSSETGNTSSEADVLHGSLRFNRFDTMTSWLSEKVTFHEFKDIKNIKVF